MVTRALARSVPLAELKERLKETQGLMRLKAHRTKPHLQVVDQQGERGTKQARKKARHPPNHLNRPTMTILGILHPDQAIETTSRGRSEDNLPQIPIGAKPWRGSVSLPVHRG